MATITTAPTLTSLDNAGLSVTTSSPVTGSPGVGSLYDTKTLAAAAPAWLMPLASAQSQTQASVPGVNQQELVQFMARHNVPAYLAINAQRVYAATRSASTPGALSTYETDTTPTWVLFNPSNGSRLTTGAAGLDLAVPVSKLGQSTLTAALSYHQLLWTLGVTDGQAQLRSFHLSSWGGVNPVNQELLAPLPPAEGSVDQVNWTMGLNRVGNHLQVYGTDSTGRIYAARKAYSSVGSNDFKQTNAGPSPHTADHRWYYLTVVPGQPKPSWFVLGTPAVDHGMPSAPVSTTAGASFVSAVDTTAPIPGAVTGGLTTTPATTPTLHQLADADGRPIVTGSPVTFSMVRSQQVMSTSDLDGKTLRTWTKRAGGPWSPAPTSVSIDATETLVDGLRLHPLVPMSASASAHQTAATYVTSTANADGSTTFNLRWVAVEVPIPS